VLATPNGRALYRRRQSTIEPVFAEIKSPPDQTLPRPRPDRMKKRMAVGGFRTAATPSDRASAVAIGERAVGLAAERA
jgi:hypothetical protein